MIKCKVRCPICGKVIEGEVEKTYPWWTYYAYCQECDYHITESEWQEVKE